MADYGPIILASCVSFGVGWFSHVLSSRRDRQTREHAAKAAKTERKRSFLSFMAQWRSEVERENWMNMALSYQAKVHLFRAESAIIRSDLAENSRPEFDELVRRLSSLTAYQINESNSPDKTGRDIIAEPIDAMVQFVESN